MQKLGIEALQGQVRKLELLQSAALAKVCLKLSPILLVHHVLSGLLGSLCHCCAAATEHTLQQRNSCSFDAEFVSHRRNAVL